MSINRSFSGASYVGSYISFTCTVILTTYLSSDEVNVNITLHHDSISHPFTVCYNVEAIYGQYSCYSEFNPILSEDISGTIWCNATIAGHDIITATSKNSTYLDVRCK